MSGSFRKPKKSRVHFTKLIENHPNIVLSQSAIYPKGWDSIIEEFVSSVEDDPVELYAIRVRNGMLEIVLDLQDASQKVFKAIYIAYHSAYSKCSSCGNPNSHGHGNSTLCKHCYTSGVVEEETGTWLDSF